MTAPAIVQITKGHEEMGKLLKAWARNEVQRPTTPQALIDQCQPRGITISPEILSYQTIDYVEDKAGVFKIRLPSAESLTDAEKKVTEDTFAYPIPEFYRKVWGAAQPTGLVTKEERRAFHNGRIGDYCISNCI